MGAVTIELDENLVDVLGQLDQPIEQAVRELIVLELYRRAEISAAKAAHLLGRPLLEFIQWSGRLGIPYFRITEEELEAEVERIRSR